MTDLKINKIIIGILFLAFTITGIRFLVTEYQKENLEKEVVTYRQQIIKSNKQHANDQTTIKRIASDSAGLKIQLNQFKKEAGDSASLHSYFQRNNSPLAEYSFAFYRYGARYGVDPVLLGAVAMAESGGCKQFIRSTYNCFGWGSGLIPFTGYTQGIETVARQIGTSQTYRTYQETKDVGIFASIYNPAHWQEYAQKIRGFMDAIKKS